MTIHTATHADAPLAHPTAPALATALSPMPAGIDQPVARGYLLQPVQAGFWIGFDDLEFRVEESLTADEVAQALFVLTGGIPGFAGTEGESANYRVRYDEFQPGVLVVSSKAGTTAPQPGLFSTSSL